MNSAHRLHQRILSGRFIAGQSLTYEDEHGIVWSLDFADVKGLTRRMLQSEAAREQAESQLAEARAEVERLRGITPEFPPRPPLGDGLPRYGLRWNGPEEPLAVPMGDGYWTPFHLAAHWQAEHGRVRGALDRLLSCVAWKLNHGEWESDGGVQDVCLEAQRALSPETPAPTGDGPQAPPRGAATGDDE